MYFDESYFPHVGKDLRNYAVRILFVVWENKTLPSNWNPHPQIEFPSSREVNARDFYWRYIKFITFVFQVIFFLAWSWWCNKSTNKVMRYSKAIQSNSDKGISNKGIILCVPRGIPLTEFDCSQTPIFTVIANSIWKKATKSMTEKITGRRRQQSQIVSFARSILLT